MRALRGGILTLFAVGALAAGVYALVFASRPAPAVVFTSLQGERIPTERLRGRVVLVNFWATDCPVCMREMPEMVRTYDKYREQGLELIAVAMRHDPPNYVIRYVEKNLLPFQVALDPMGELAKAFGDVSLTPTTFLIDKRGNIVSRILGEPDFSKLHRLVERKLQEPA